MACFCGERACAAIHKHHRAFDGQPVIVRSRAARGVVHARDDQRAGDAAVGCADGELERLGLDRIAADGQLRILCERQPHLELWGLHVETLVAQRLDDVVDARVVTRGAKRARSVVGVGELLQFLQVRHHRVGLDAAAQRRTEFGCRT